MYTYFLDDIYPFEILRSKDNNDGTTYSFANAEVIGSSRIKAEIRQRQRVIEFIEEGDNNYHKGGKILSTSYMNLLKTELDILINEYPEELI